MAAQPSAKETIGKTTQKLQKAASVDIVFTVWNGGNSSTGRLVLGGRNFYLTTPDMKVWFDGTSLWSYLKAADEVNLSKPTRDELAQINPLSILGAIGNNYKLRRLASPEGTDKIELIPNKPSDDFAKAVVTIATATALPREVAIYDARGTATTIKISSAKVGQALPISTFRYNPRQFPGVEVIDLR